MSGYSNLVVSLREMQENCCGICGGEAGKLVVDHDHCSGLVRGLLCHSCNNDEGRHGDCGNETCGICWWRIRPAVAWLGWTVRYEPSWGRFGNNPDEQPLLLRWAPADKAARSHHAALDAGCWLAAEAAARSLPAIPPSGAEAQP